MKNPKKDGFISKAKIMRKHSTEAETLLWNHIRNKNIEDCNFRRQHPVAGYILDFYCPKLKLAIELDGSGHAKDNKVEKDKKRTTDLEKIGIKVLRFWNNEVLQNIESVVDVITVEITKRKETLT